MSLARNDHVPESAASCAFREAGEGLVVFRLRDGLIVQANPAADALAGRGAGGLVGLPLVEVFVPDPEAGLPPLAELAGAADFRGRLPRPVGPPLALSGRLCPAGGEGEALGVLFVRTDAEEARRRAEVLQTILDNIPVMISFFDPSGTVRWVNRTNEQTLGWSIQDVGREDLLTVSFPDPAERDRVRAFMLEASGEWMEQRIRTRDGRLLDAVWANVRLSDGWCIGIGQDVTERKKAEAERAALQRNLLEAQKLESLGALAGGVAHGFNNLLTSVLGYASLAQGELPAGSPVRGYVEQIEQAAGRAADLCGQMLAYAGKGRFVVGPVDLAALARGSADLLRLTAVPKAELSLRLEEGLPRVRADAAQLRQALFSLVANAAEALGDGGGRVVVAVGRRRLTRADLAAARLGEGLPEGEYVALEVGDDGPGMTAEVQRRLFEPFFTTKFTGRGLSLAAVLGIVRGHRGALQVESAPGRGSTVRVLLPADESAPASGPTPAPTAPPQAQGTVLVADDEPGVRGLASVILGGLGFRPVTAADGVEALEQAQREAAGLRLVLLDLTMPRMDGGQTLPELRRLCPHVPVVLMSGYSEHEVSERFAGRGVAGFLHKPFARDELVRKVREALGHG